MNKEKVTTIIRRIILVIAIAVFCYSAYMLIHIYLEYKRADDIYTNIEHNVLEDTNDTVIIDDTEIELPFVYNHDALLAINPEGIGYIYIPSIDIRLPLVQGPDNDFYLSHTFDKSRSNNGCLFEDCNITDGIASSHVILYGHSIKNGSMFGQLPKYGDYSFWETEGNSVFYIYTENKLMEYKIFSAYVCDPIGDTYNYNFTTLDAMRSYASMVKGYSLYDTGVDVSNASQVVTLSTCTYDGDQRFVVQGVYVGETTLNN